MRTVLGMAMILVGLCGCSASSSEPSASDLQLAQSSRPRDPQLAERYARSCMLCHTVQGSGAPLTGYVPHWDRRLAQGMDQMLRHAEGGFNAMPARGQCNDCSLDDLRGLTSFMSGKEAQ